MTKIGVVSISVFGAFLVAASAAAEETANIFLNATFLGAPVEWCPATDGIPLIIRMDGPDIVKGPSITWRVKERRGSSVRTTSSDDVASSNRPGMFDRPDSPPGMFDWSNAKVVGRFSAEFQTCYSPWRPFIARPGRPWRTFSTTGTWHLKGTDGSDLEEGEFEDKITELWYPFFSHVSGTDTVYLAKFGDRQLYTAQDPEQTVSLIFLAEPDKE